MTERLGFVYQKKAIKKQPKQNKTKEEVVNDSSLHFVGYFFC